VVPGIPRYELGSPAFDRITIHHHNGRTLELVCKNNSRDNKYIRSVRFNGQPQNRVWFRHADVLKGLKIELELADTPNTSLGADPAQRPQSSITFDPRVLVQ